MVVIYSEEKTEAIEELKSRLEDLELSDEWTNPGCLFRWLEARDFNVPKAEQMLRESLKWRTDNKVDSILEDWPRPADLYRTSPFEKCGVDNEGCPVYISDNRNFDMSVCLKYELEDHLKMNRHVLESVMLDIKSQNEIHGCVHHIVIISDLEGFSFRNFLFEPRFLDTFRKCTNESLLNYPEIAKTFYFVYAPRLFTVAFALFKPMLPAATLAKMKVFGCNKDEWSSELLKAIPADQLPVRYGGTNTEYETRLMKIYEDITPTPTEEHNE